MSPFIYMPIGAITIPRPDVCFCRRAGKPDKALQTAIITAAGTRRAEKAPRSLFFGAQLCYNVYN